MAILEKGDLLIGGFLLTKQAALLSPHFARIANDGRKGLDERMEAARSAEAMSVALAQPHRMGDAGKRAGDALAVFCERLLLRRECYNAGQMYERQCRAEKKAHGFYVVDSPGGENDPTLTEEEIAANNEKAIMKFANANGVLVLVHPRCPRRMELLCYDRLTPSVYDDDILRNGLYGLARHYGMVNEGINRDRA